MKSQSMHKTFKLRRHGKRLWTRQLGQEVRRSLEDLLSISEPGTVVEVNCDSVEVFDVSFAAEFFCKSLLRLPSEYPNRYIMISGLGEYTRMNLDAALKDIGLMALEKQDSKLELIGKFMSSDRETLKALMERRTAMSAAELAALLDIKVTAANERLTKLAKRSVVRRQYAEKGRSQQIYRSVA